MLSPARQSAGREPPVIYRAVTRRLDAASFFFRAPVLQDAIGKGSCPGKQTELARATEHLIASEILERETEAGVG